MIVLPPVTYKPKKLIPFNWTTFVGGLNKLLRENEIADNELAQADDLYLIGRGVPTKRWGTSLYYQAGAATGAVRGLRGFYKSDGTNELLGFTDAGYLTKKSGASYSTLTGVSWASGNNMYMAQLNNTMYLVDGVRPLAKYSSPTLVGFSTIAIPVIVSATNLSGASGTTSKGYRVSAISQVGETLASTEFILNNQPAALGGVAGGTIRLTWTGVSTASILQGFNVYGRDPGNEKFIAGVGPQATTYDDTGLVNTADFVYPPIVDSTRGPTAKYIVRLQDRLVMAGIAGSPSMVVISGHVPLQERYDIANGGNSILIEPDAGDNVTGLAAFRDRVVVFKQRSIWQIFLTEITAGNFTILVPVVQLVTASYGCVAPRSITSVENDIYFMARDGLYSLGYQLGYLSDLLRANPLYLKIRPFFDNLTTTQKQNACAAYYLKKYIIAFPGLGQGMTYDVERSAWMGPWTRDANVYEVYTDSNSDQHLLYGDVNDTNVQEYNKTFPDDNGVAIQTILRTRQEDFGDWSLFKNIKNIFVQFRNITGSVAVSIRLEQRSGSTVTAKSFTVTPVTGNSGWGADIWGTAIWGTSLVGGGGINTQQTIKWRELNMIARIMQITVTTTTSADNYELLGIRGDANIIGGGVRPSQWKQVLLLVLLAKAIVPLVLSMITGVTMNT